MSERKIIYDGVEYLADEAETFEDGSIHDATLFCNTNIQGLPCASGHSVVFYRSGRLKLAWLSTQSYIDNILCEATIVYLHENGELLNASLAASTKFDAITLPVGTRVTLNEHGDLIEYSRQLQSDEIINGINCSGNFNVWLYPSGRLSTAILASRLVIGSKEYNRGTELFLDESGSVIESNIMDIDFGVRYKQRIFGRFETSFQ
jgi:hypothetical protein